MIKFLATRRWNFIDIIGTSIAIGCGIKGQWWEWIVVVLVTLILSLMAENKAGVE